MALDMYGGGKVATDPDEAGGLMNGLLENLGTVRTRFNAALEVLKAHKTTDAGKSGAIGYCMGGGIVLHMARYGADLKAVASFHGAHCHWALLLKVKAVMSPRESPFTTARTMC